MIEELNLIKKIRGHRVNKKRKKLFQEEMQINRLQSKSQEIVKKMIRERKTYQEEKDESIKKMLTEKFNVDQFSILQKKEKIFESNLTNGRRENEKLLEEVASKKSEYRKHLVELAALEKSEIKIEEYIKMELE